jgi:hypothetical protein
MLGHYREFAVIDTGTFNVSEVKAGVEDLAKLLKISVRVIPGNLRLIGALLSGDWREEDFLAVKPGGRITLEDSLSAGSAGM